jgi:hypothetical protein
MEGGTLKINFVVDVFGAIIPLVDALVTVPIYLRHIGDARYGVLSIVWVLLGYFGFHDLGLSRAAANALARLRHAPQAARARVLVTTLVLNLGLGLFGSLCLAVFGSYLLQHVLGEPEALKLEIAQAFPWVVGLFPLLSSVGIGENRGSVFSSLTCCTGMSLGRALLKAIVLPLCLLAGSRFVGVYVGPNLWVSLAAGAIAGIAGVTLAIVVSKDLRDLISALAPRVPGFLILNRSRSALTGRPETLK